MAAAPNSVVSLQKELEKCEPTIRHSAVMRTDMFISFPSGWCFHNVEICTVCSSNPKGKKYRSRNDCGIEQTEYKIELREMKQHQIYSK